MSPSQETSRTRTAVLAGGVALALVFLAVAADLHQPVLTWWYRTTPPTAPTVVFVVLDTLRADRTSACGYGKPTTPTLEALVRGGASLDCDAVAAGAWTLPSHASMFTGVPQWRHGADRASAEAGGSIDIFGLGRLTRPLPEHFPTLAERFRERGYQTAAVSANLVVSDTTGLLRGFDHRRAAGAIQWREDMLVDEVRDTLRGLERDGRPLFLFVNIIDAHQPFPDVPAGVGWADPQEAVYYEIGVQDGAMQRFISQQLPEAERDAFLARVNNGYDYSVFRADRTLDAVLSTLTDHGWMEAHRLVVTSDHGEFLGEHGLLDHSTYLYEPLTRVPLLVRSVGAGEVPDLATPVGPLSAMEAFWLALDGRTVGLPPVATAQPNTTWVKLSGGRVGGVTSGALWSGTEKWLAMDASTERFDLGTDPGEQDGQPVDRPEALQTVLEQHADVSSAPVEPSDEMTEMLIQAGYVEP